MNARWRIVGWIAGFMPLCASASHAGDPPQPPRGSIFDPPPGATSQPGPTPPVAPPAAPANPAGPPDPTAPVNPPAPVAPLVPALDPAIPRATQRIFHSDDKLTGSITLDAGGSPYEIRDKLSPSDRLKEYTIQIGPGAEVHGGGIEILAGGRVVIAGTPDHPALIRDINFEQALRGDFAARCAIFINCTFRKIGGKFTNHSAKWTFEDCIIHGPAPFPSFKGNDYGFKFDGCTFEGITFPEINGKVPKDRPPDDMLYLRSEWNKIIRCRFEDCVVPPTVFWCSELSNFSRCRFVPGAAFDSESPTETTAYVSGTIGDPPGRVFARNPPKRAAMRVIYAPDAFPVFVFPGRK